jgi:hypothetical protein
LSPASKDRRTFLDGDVLSLGRAADRQFRGVVDEFVQPLSEKNTELESGVEFVVADFPQANRLTIHILAALAEYERKTVSERTKLAPEMELESCFPPFGNRCRER